MYKPHSYLFKKKCSNIWWNTLLGAVYFSRSDPPTLLYKLEKREKNIVYVIAMRLFKKY
jgi:hypothetical protein